MESTSDTKLHGADSLAPAAADIAVKLNDPQLQQLRRGGTVQQGAG